MDIRFVIAFPRVGSGRLPVSAQQYPLLSEPHRLPASVITSYEGEEFFGGIGDGYGAPACDETPTGAGKPRVTACEPLCAPITGRAESLPLPADRGRIWAAVPPLRRSAYPRYLSLSNRFTRDEKKSRMDYNFLAKTRTANDALKVLHIRFIQLCLE